MICPKCESQNVYVIDSRKREKFKIYRRRRCMDCGYRFTTSERPINKKLWEKVGKK